MATFAAALATRTGRWLAAQRQRHRAVPTHSKAVGDPVTALDIEAERRLRLAISRRWPKHGFLGEESGGHGEQRSLVWIVDPIDGTANFAAGLQPWGVSVACLANGEPVVGAVHCQPEGVTLHAARGRGCFLGTRRLRLAEPQLGADAILSVNWFRGAKQTTFVQRLVDTGARVRVHGCTVVQMLDVVRGRMAANIQEQGKVWDLAAAGLILIEAGGCVLDWRGEPLFPWPASRWGEHRASLAAAPLAARELLEALAPHRRSRSHRVTPQ